MPGAEGASDRADGSSRRSGDGEPVLPNLIGFIVEVRIPHDTAIDRRAQPEARATGRRDNQPNGSAGSQPVEAASATKIDVLYFRPRTLP
jgi:hypothetical protein